MQVFLFSVIISELLKVKITCRQICKHTDMHDVPIFQCLELSLIKLIVEITLEDKEPSKVSQSLLKEYADVFRDMRGVPRGVKGPHRTKCHTGSKPTADETDLDRNSKGLRKATSSAGGWQESWESAWTTGTSTRYFRDHTTLFATELVSAVDARSGHWALSHLC